jgi:hypothetical protein
MKPAPGKVEECWVPLTLEPSSAFGRVMTGDSDVCLLSRGNGALD